MSSRTERGTYRNADFASLESPDLHFLGGGFHASTPDFKIGPKTIPEFGVVFVYSGTGWALQSGRRVALKGGEIFLIYPNVRYAFAAQQPWDVYWLNFTSRTLAAALRRVGMSPRNFVCRGGDREHLRNSFEQLIAASHLKRRNVPKLLCLTWEILLALTRSPAQPSTALQRVFAARRQIDEHPCEAVPVSKLAQLSRLSRFHFIRAFRKEVGMSPRQYQIHRRMTVARRLLLEGRSVKETALACGFDDLFYFSKLFKQKLGVPPSQYRHTRPW
jgi:AraC-like DNA-binding protein